MNQELALIRELGELQRSYSLLDNSEENKKRGKRILEIKKELGLIQKSKKTWLDRDCRTVKW